MDNIQKATKLESVIYNTLSTEKLMNFHERYDAFRKECISNGYSLTQLIENNFDAYLIEMQGILKDLLPIEDLESIL